MGSTRLRSRSLSLRGLDGVVILPPDWLRKPFQILRSFNTTPEQAEIAALKVLGWLVTDEELLPIFMGSTGVDQDELRQSASTPEFLGSVLDFFMMDDRWVMRVCDALDLRYEDFAAIRHTLPGGADYHWT